VLPFTEPSPPSEEASIQLQIYRKKAVAAIECDGLAAWLAQGTWALDSKKQGEGECQSPQNETQVGEVCHTAAPGNPHPVRLASITHSDRHSPVGEPVEPCCVHLAASWISIVTSNGTLLLPRFAMSECHHHSHHPHSLLPHVTAGVGPQCY
jgi:hypothetical protein